MLAVLWSETNMISKEIRFNSYGKKAHKNRVTRVIDVYVYFHVKFDWSIKVIMIGVAKSSHLQRTKRKNNENLKIIIYIIWNNRYLYSCWEETDRQNVSSVGFVILIQFFLFFSRWDLVNNGMVWVRRNQVCFICLLNYLFPTRYSSISIGLIPNNGM